MPLEIFTSLPWQCRLKTYHILSLRDYNLTMWAQIIIIAISISLIQGRESVAYLCRHSPREAWYTNVNKKDCSQDFGSSNANSRLTIRLSHFQPHSIGVFCYCEPTDQITALEGIIGRFERSLQQMEAVNNKTLDVITKSINRNYRSIKLIHKKIR